MAKAMPNPADAAERWATNFGASGPKWVAGVQAVTAAPGAMAARAADRWEQNTIAAKPKFATNSARVTREEWISVTVAKGQGRLSSGAQAAKQKVATVFGPLFQHIDSVRNGLPPRGDLEANINRSAQFARGMAKFRTGG